MWISNGSICLNFTLCPADCVHGKCWTKGGGEERYTKLSDMAWGFFLFMKFVHGTGRNQIAIKLIRWRLHSIASYIKTVRKNR